jgi:hypothetical protein
MAQGNDWNSFMQQKTTRVLLNALVACMTAFYAIDAVRELITPTETALIMIEQIGRPAYLTLTIARLLVCIWVSVTFARLVIKTLKEEDK